MKISPIVNRSIISDASTNQQHTNKTEETCLPPVSSSSEHTAQDNTQQIQHSTQDIRSRILNQAKKEQMDIQRKKALDLTQPIINKMMAILPELTEKREFLLQEAVIFLSDTIAVKYLFDQYGNPVSLEGTPKGGLSSEIEFQKTMGSCLALRALHSGCNIFGSSPDSENSLEKRLAILLNCINTHFSGQFQNNTDPLISILAIHDILKSQETSQLVRTHLKNNPVVFNEITYSEDKFQYLDHDSQLLVALYLMEKEVLNSTDANPQALTAEFFPQQKIIDGEHRAIVQIMKTMWGMQLNSLQTNQGENHPAQLTPFLAQVISTTDAEYETLKLSLKTWCVHEATDLLGAANPHLPVLPKMVVEPVLNMFDTLIQYADNLRQESSTAAINIEEKAKEFYKKLLPELDKATVEKVKNTLNDDAQTLILVSRLSRMCRMEKKDVEWLISALDMLHTRDINAYTALHEMYGSLDKSIYLYYGPALLENLNIKSPYSAAIIPQLTNALHTLGIAAQQCEIEITGEGGAQSFAQKYGTDFINIRACCLGILEHLQNCRASEKEFNPASLKFIRSDNNLALASNLSQIHVTE